MTHWLLDLAQARLNYVEIGRGIHQLTCWPWERFPPVGLVWLFGAGDRRGGRTADIVFLWTDPRFRRRGVATRILDEALAHFSTLLTWSGSAEGKPFLRAFGFRWDRRAHRWVVNRDLRARAAKEGRG